MIHHGSGPDRDGIDPTLLGVAWVMLAVASLAVLFFC